MKMPFKIIEKGVGGMDSLASQIKATAINLGYGKCGIIKIADMAAYCVFDQERREQE